MIVTVIQFLTVSVLSLAVYRRWLHPLAAYPGPFLASISNVWKFYHYMKGNLHVVEQNLHHQYGPILRTGPNTLSFSDPAAFESIYGFNHGFEKGEFYAFARDATTGASNTFSARTHAEHRELRRQVVGAALTSSHVHSYRPIVVKHVQHFISKLCAEIPTSGKGNGVVDIAKPIHALTFNTLAETIYGPALSSEPWSETPRGAGILEAFRALSKFSWGCSYIPFLSWLMSTGPMIRMTRKPTFSAAGLPTGIAALVSRTQFLLLDEPNMVLMANQPSIAKNMLTLEKGVSRYNDSDAVWRECFNLLFAGPGSTAAAVTGVLERLGTEEGKEWQQKIRDELGQVNHHSDSKVLSAVIRESLRFSAPFPTAFPREVHLGAEKAIPGLNKPLPLGTLVSANSWIVSHDERTWGRDAGSWKPERWLHTEDNAGKRSMDDNLLVFSKGPRGCIGKEIAMTIVTEAVAGVVAKWRIEKVGQMKSGGWLEMQIGWCGMHFTSID
ncbi:hypothetical protein HYFRA_00010688 [Hymenoscyphus fraxineus]|uniref:Uncharacterized protein n=1 Tax=Hymenoscyphus fraxineus TaxID=746836 RepID=A0A9N9L034_9HELO|nr:hypothetical protein HYFRA_00010688 [Hymenoscyphus fraxineus]